MLNKIPFAGWKVKEKIGFGGFCNVFRVEKDGYNSAVKQIIIPNDKEYMSVLSRFGGNEEEFYKYYDPEKNKMIKEIEIMRNLRGIPGIVIYQDHIIRKYEKRHGWEILILMEYLQPLDKYVLKKGIKVNQVLKMVVELCSSLEACHRENILHRDIKEGNIFLDKRGIFKIGDFGISKIMEGISHVSTRVGTKWYMAPEVYKGDKYDYRADIYSLGLVMYKLLNDNLLPFMKKRATISDDEIAKEKIMNGEILPKPYKADDKIYDIILKACSYDREKRYKSFSEMGDDTSKVLADNKSVFLDTYAVYPIKKNINTVRKTSIIKLDNIPGNTLSYRENINNIYDNVHKSYEDANFIKSNKSENIHIGNDSITNSVIKVLGLSKSKVLLTLFTIIFVIGVFLIFEINNLNIKKNDSLKSDKEDSVKLGEFDKDEDFNGEDENTISNENSYNESDYSDVNTHNKAHKEITTSSSDEKENDRKQTDGDKDEITAESTPTADSTEDINIKTSEVTETPVHTETDNSSTVTPTATPTVITSEYPTESPKDDSLNAKKAASN